MESTRSPRSVYPDLGDMSIEESDPLPPLQSLVPKSLPPKRPPPPRSTSVPMNIGPAPKAGKVMPMCYHVYTVYINIYRYGFLAELVGLFSTCGVLHTHTHTHTHTVSSRNLPIHPALPCPEHHPRLPWPPDSSRSLRSNLTRFAGFTKSPARPGPLSTVTTHSVSKTAIRDCRREGVVRMVVRCQCWGICMRSMYWINYADPYTGQVKLYSTFDDSSCFTFSVTFAHISLFE